MGRPHPLAALAAATVLAAAPAAQRPDEEVRAAWGRLSRAERVEAVEWLRFELGNQESVLGSLVKFVERRADVDPGFWPDLGPVPFFEPSGKRERLEPDDERAAALRERVGKVAPPLWSYDYATRRLVRHGDPDDPERVLAEALAGRHPDLDYVVALVERSLDDGRFQASFAALGHAYTEPDGAVHPDVTLYDVLASGEALQLDEVDAVETLRWVMGDECPWTSPVPAARRLELDRAVLDLYDEAAAWRETLHGVARAYAVFEPSPLVEEPLLLQALWNSAESDPVALAPRLPGPDRRERFFADWAEQVRVRKLRTDATYRTRDLAEGERLVRAWLEWVLGELGAYDERRAPPAETPPPPPGGDELTGAGPALGPEAEAALLARVAKLPSARRAKLLARCVEAVRACGARQVELVAQWAARVPAELPEPAAFEAHDAKVYGGGPKRRAVAPGDRLWDRLIDDVTFEPPPRRPVRADYEFATGRVVAAPPPPPAPAEKKQKRRSSRATPEEEPDEVAALRELLAGIPPDQDLAEAALLAELDRGSGLRPVADFFAHLYSDRDGNAYRGITLFDAWSSDFEFEVPDVDALAYARLVWGDVELRPPLSGADHDLWYPRMGNSLKELRTRMRVARALAAVWFEARPRLAHGYDASIDIAHAAIALAGEDPAVLARALEQDGSSFLKRALSRVAGMGNDGWNRGNGRRDELRRGAGEVRRAVLGILAEEGLLPE